MRKGKTARVLEGEHSHQAVRILKYPDLDKAIGWYGSDEYQALISNRNLAADLTVNSHEEPTAGIKDGQELRECGICRDKAAFPD